MTGKRPPKKSPAEPRAEDPKGMTRIRDPLGQFPDRLHADLSEAAVEDVFKMFQRIARASDPAPRIEALKRHPEMVDTATELAWDLEALRGKANALFHARLAQAEAHAGRLDDRPKVERVAKAAITSSKGGTKAAQTKAKHAAANKARAVKRFKMLVASGERDATAAIEMMVAEGFSRSALYLHTKEERQRLGRKPVKRATARKKAAPPKT